MIDRLARYLLPVCESWLKILWIWQWLPNLLKTNSPPPIDISVFLLNSHRMTLWRLIWRKCFIYLFFPIENRTWETPCWPRFLTSLLVPDVSVFLQSLSKPVSPHLKYNLLQWYFNIFLSAVGWFFSTDRKNENLFCILKMTMYYIYCYICFMFVREVQVIFWV